MVILPTEETSEFKGIANLDFLVSKVTQLISLPDIYYRLETAIESPTSNVQEFARLLGSDPDLCARLLRVANSAFYSFPAKIETIERAVTTIGLRQIRELVLVTSVMKIFNQLPAGGLNMKLFWEHSIAVGVLAKSIARYAGLAQSERFYIPGLLHDIGRLVMHIKMPNLMQELMLQHRRQGELLHILELQHLSYSHAEIGGRLLEFWNVPESICEPVYNHHYPDKSHEFAAATCAVHMADIWVNRHQTGSTEEQRESHFDPETTRLLGIQEYEMEELWAITRDEINDVTRRFAAH